MKWVFAWEKSMMDKGKTAFMERLEKRRASYRRGRAMILRIYNVKQNLIIKSNYKF